MDEAVCPNCLSQHFDYVKVDLTAEKIELPVASFSKFMNLNETAKESLIGEYWNEWNSIPDDLRKERRFWQVQRQESEDSDDI